MFIFSIIAYSFLIISVLSFIFALKGRYKLYWVSTFGIYFFSFLAGFSIGQLTVGLTFIPLSLALGYSFNWIKSKRSFYIVIITAALFGFIIVLFNGNLLFSPFIPLFRLLH